MSSQNKTFTHTATLRTPTITGLQRFNHSEIRLRETKTMWISENGDKFNKVSGAHVTSGYEVFKSNVINVKVSICIV